MSRPCARSKPLNFQPGSRFLYSNSNFTMIAQIVHRISGMDLPDFAQQHIFTPLGMTHTCIRRGYWQMIPELASLTRMTAADGLFPVRSTLRCGEPPR